MKSYYIFILLDIILVILIIITGVKSKNNQAAMVSGQSLYDSEKKIALTFDDGPSTEYTGILLDGLKERNVHVTFFVIGKLAERNPELIKRMFDEGHLIGNHTYDHVQLNKLSLGEAYEQLTKTNTVITKITGDDVEYVRPPFGEWNKKLDKSLEMIPVLWDIDPRDWNSDNEPKIFDKVVTKVRENDIILMHDTSKSSVDAALKIIDTLTEQGFEFITVDKLIME